MYCKIEIPGYPGRIFSMPQIFCYHKNGNNNKKDEKVREVIDKEKMDYMLDTCLVGVNKKKGTKKKLKMCKTVRLKDAIEKSRLSKKIRESVRNKNGLKRRKTKKKKK